MSDILQELREAQEDWDKLNDAENSELIGDAIREIERLQLENAQLIRAFSIYASNEIWPLGFEKP